MWNDFLMLYTDPAFESPIEALFAYPGHEGGRKGGREGGREGRVDNRSLDVYEGGREERVDDRFLSISSISIVVNS